MSVHRADVWLVNLDPVEGREQAGRRPALIVSVDAFNASSELVTALPITSRERRLRTRVRVDPPEGGLSVVSYVLCEQPRTISQRRLVKLLGSVSPATMFRAEQIVRLVLGL